MTDLTEIHKVLRTLRCIAMPLMSIHTGVYSAMLRECENIVYKVAHVQPTLYPTMTANENAQLIIDAVVSGLFEESDMSMLTAIEVRTMEKHFSTTLAAVQSLLSGNPVEYIRLLNENNPSDIYFQLFHPIDKITRNTRDEITCIETPICNYRAK